jgi:hypothetical protein
VRSLKGWFTRPLFYSIQYAVKMQFELLFNRTVASELFTNKYFLKTILIYISSSPLVKHSTRKANITKQMIQEELDISVSRTIGSDFSRVYLFA